ncbi:MAG TPA: tetratricopeptide repeat protein [Polyangiales bacterium]|nr:tetratricopeptide repeat protein [Polyangiales bacterium]
MARSPFVLVLSTKLCLAFLIAEVVHAERIEANKIIGDCNAVGNDIIVTCNDVKAIRNALEPALRAQLDRMLPSLNAQRVLIENFVRQLESKQDQILSDTVGLRAGQKTANRKLDLILTAQQVTQSLQGWIDRAQHLERELKDPDKAQARTALKSGDLDGAEQSLAELYVKQADNLTSWQAVEDAAQKAQQAATRGKFTQRVELAKTQAVRGEIAYLKLDFEQSRLYLREAILSLRELREQGHDEDELQIQRASALLAIGYTFGVLERREEALRAAQVATAIYRKLVEKDSKKYQPDLATALSALANALAKLGQYDSALQAAQDVAKTYADLADQNPDEYAARYATSLCNLGVMLNEQARYSEAILVLQVAVEVQRPLKDKDRDAFARALAFNLGNLATAYFHAHRAEEALATELDAIILVEDLAKRSPAAFSRDLAMARNNLGMTYLEMNMVEEAVDVIERGVTLCRRLGDSGCSRPRLALVLDSAGLIYSRAERYGDALDVTEQAVRMRRELSVAHPTNVTYLRDLATSLSHLARWQKQLGQQSNSFASVEEAVKIQSSLTSRYAFLKPELDESVRLLESITPHTR